MKRIFILTAVFFIVLFTRCNQFSQSKEEQSATITISGAFALYPLTVKWAEEFKKLYPKTRIDISAGGAGKGMTDALSNVVDIGLVSREIYAEEINKGAWYIAVAKDAVVPTISEVHPQLHEILNKGITKETLENIFIHATVKTWSQAGIKSNLPIHVYTRSDAAGAAESWAKYFNKKQEDLRGIGVFGDPGLEQAVMKDQGAIGYNNLVYVYDSRTKQQANGVRIIPIDLNNNGQIDPEENFYTSLDDLTQAIADGKYPSPPARDLFFVTRGKPQKKIVLEFIKWILTDGQRFVHEAGYINLSKEKNEEGLDKLTGSP